MSRDFVVEDRLSVWDWLPTQPTDPLIPCIDPRLPVCLPFASLCSPPWCLEGVQILPACLDGQGRRRVGACLDPLACGLTFGGPDPCDGVCSQGMALTEPPHHCWHASYPIFSTKPVGHEPTDFPVALPEIDARTRGPLVIAAPSSHDAVAPYNLGSHRIVVGMRV